MFKQQQTVHHEEPQKNGSNSNELLTYTEAAEHCHLRSSSKLRVAVRRRELQAVQLGPKTVRFQRSELDRWLNE